MADNMAFYDQLRTPPKDAIEAIKEGRLKGKDSIKPQWRIDAMTRAFGPCGIGWKYKIVGYEEIPGAEGDLLTSCQVEVFIKVDGEWSEPIPGIGGAKLVAKEKSGLRLDDDARKKALTDALSVAFRFLGVGADIYRGGSDRALDKYQQPPQEEKPDHIKRLKAERERLGLSTEWVKEVCLKTEGWPDSPLEMTPAQVDELIGYMNAAVAAANATNH